jgi:hypothetical protein
MIKQINFLRQPIRKLSSSFITNNLNASTNTNISFKSHNDWFEKTNYGYFFEEDSLQKQENTMNVNMRIEKNAKLICNSGHKLETSDIDDNGNLTVLGRYKIAHPVEKIDIDEDGIHIRDKYTDWLYGKNLDDMPKIQKEDNDTFQGIRFKHSTQNLNDKEKNDTINNSIYEAIIAENVFRPSGSHVSSVWENIDDIDEIDEIDEIPDSFFD